MVTTNSQVQHSQIAKIKFLHRSNALCFSHSILKHQSLKPKHLKIGTLTCPKPIIWKHNSLHKWLSHTKPWLWHVDGPVVKCQKPKLLWPGVAAHHQFFQLAWIYTKWCGCHSGSLVSTCWGPFGCYQVHPWSLIGISIAHGQSWFWNGCG